MDINKEIGLVISESAHEQELLSSSQWRSRVTHRNKSSDDDTTHFVTGRGFQKKYPTLGDTKVARVPYIIHKDIMAMVSHFEQIAQTHDIDYVHKIIERIMEGLEAID
jgi:predicted double-glycine peptidase